MRLVLVTAHREEKVWEDPWGRLQPADVIDTLLAGDFPETEARVQFDYGYGPGSVVEGKVYRTPTGFIAGRPPMDYHASTVYFECDENGKRLDDGRLLTRPSLGASYWYDGAPWLPPKEG